jgi:hypothetical protein
MLRSGECCGYGGDVGEWEMWEMWEMWARERGQERDEMENVDKRSVLWVWG